MGGNRITQVEMNGTMICLNDYYHNNQAKVTYNVFRTRVINHLDIISEKLLYDALNLSTDDWRSFYGGGKRKKEGFTYEGNHFLQYRNKTFHTLSAFLKLVGKYENYSTIKRRVRVGWDIDEAILRENIDVSIGRIYLIETTQSPLKYVGQTVKSLEERFIEHKQAYQRPKRKNKSRLLFNAFDDFGLDTFFIRLLEDNIEYKKLAERENYWINQLGTMFPKGLNMIKGVNSSVGYGIKISYMGKEYNSVKTLIKEIQKEKPDLPDYTIEKCIRHNRKLPVKPRVHSKHPDAGKSIWRRWKSLLKKNELCSEWSILENGIGYDNFINDMGCPISKKYKLYKINNKLLHSKENSRWMTDTEIQEQEKGISVVVFGKKYNSRSTLAKEYNLSLSTLNYRIEKRKMSAEEAVTYSGKTTQSISCEYDGIKFSSKGEMYRYCSEKYGLTLGQVKDHFQRGIPLDKKLSLGYSCVIGEKTFENIKDALAYYQISPKTFYRIRKKFNFSAEEAIKYLLENKD